MQYNKTAGELRSEQGPNIQPPFFWLHIKKSGGMTIRELLAPHYVEVDRTCKPKTFIQATPSEYNDILNNYRVPLGEYQFKRCLFAKRFLYPDTYSDIVSFAFSREPVDRCVSMFFYLFYHRQHRWISLLKSTLKESLRHKKLYNISYAFDCFLQLIDQAQNSHSVFLPKGLSFSTHTNPMWNDITDNEGNLLLKYVFRLDDLIAGINQVYELCGIKTRLCSNVVRINVNKRRKPVTPTREQCIKIKMLYAPDFEIYESAYRPA